MVVSISRSLDITTETGEKDTMAKKNTLAKPQSQKSNGTTKSPSQACDPNNLRYAALHEAGHAVSAVVLGMNLKKVFIKQCPTTGVSVGFTDLGGYTADDLAGKGEEAVMPYLIQCFTGPRAEFRENLTVTKTFAFAMDHQDAYHVAHHAICELTHRDKGTIGATQAEVNWKAVSRSRMLLIAWLKAGMLLDVHWQAVLEVADLLRQKKKVTSKKVAAIVNAARAASNSCIAPRPRLTP
jgi:hypothetical protein